jgi:MEDS: MEthanogen/methylotroph, DcmR Sensory domain
MRPHDHIGWVFSTPEEFAGVAGPFLKEGVELGERVVFVAADPDEEAYRNLAASFDPADLIVASSAEIYGESGIVEPAGQRATFAATLAQARADGHTGIRVAADNTALIQTPERLAAWMHWELVADRFMSANAVTGLCGFNRSVANVDALRHVVTLHPLSSAADPLPQFRLFVDDDGLSLEGDIDDLAIGYLNRALEMIPKGMPATVNLRQATPRDGLARRELGHLADAGVPLRY